MAIIITRRFRPHACLGVLIGLVVSMAGVASAQAAPAGSNQLAGPNGQTAAGPASVPASAQSQAGALSQMTGLHPSQVAPAAACPPAGPGAVRCAAQVLVVRSNRKRVRPSVRRGASFTQVFPRVAKGIAPAVTIAASPPRVGTPAYLQQAYDLSYLSQTAGSSDTVAIVDAYDDPGAQADLATYRATYGLPACTTANGCFRKVNESGASSPLPSGNLGWEVEISLDLQAVSALCPRCHILLVEASSSWFTDMDQAVVTAAAMGAKQISASWAGGAVGPISGTYSFPGVAVIAATGDAGHDGPGWDAYPAALPGVTAAGGTTLAPSSTSFPGARGFSESAWSLSGGWGGGSGCDVYEAKPSYQTDTGCIGRSYADVSADANPNTGLIGYDSANGGWMLLGGTSLATPLIAAYEAVTGINAASPRWAYANSALLNDPITGSNGSCAATIFYICNARVGYDGPTGAGSISGDVVPGGPGIGGPGIGSGTNNSYTQSVTSTGATLTGGVYPNGVVTAYWWQYGTTTAYGQQTPALSVGSGHAAATVITPLGGLAVATTYHYRLVAQNGYGTSYGYDYTLTTNPSPPVNTGVPVVSGAARVGQVLSSTSGSWSPTGANTYQWQRATSSTSGWANITGATSASYTLIAADRGDSVRLTVTATNPYGTASSSSTPTGPVLSGAPAATSPPVLSAAGAARVGKVLSSTGGAWSPTGANTYQWQRATSSTSGWANIAGATSASYTLIAADRGDSVRLTVTATNPYGTASSSSTPTGPVA